MALTTTHPLPRALSLFLSHSLSPELSYLGFYGTVKTMITSVSPLQAQLGYSPSSNQPNNGVSGASTSNRCHKPTGVRLLWSKSDKLRLIYIYNTNVEKIMAPSDVFELEVRSSTDLCVQIALRCDYHQRVGVRYAQMMYIYIYIALGYWLSIGTLGPGCCEDI